jgi:hypothetical protein
MLDISRLATALLLLPLILLSARLCWSRPADRSRWLLVAGRSRWLPVAFCPQP